MTTEVEPPSPPSPPPPSSEFPLDLTIGHPEHQRILTNIPVIGTAIRYILILPSLLIVYAIFSAALYAYLAATFVILFTGRYPRGLFKLIVGTMRWNLNTQAYLSHLFDNYPPLDLDERPDWWVKFAVGYPDRPSRILNFPLLGLVIKIILTVPHVVVLYLLNAVSLVLVLIADFAIIFSGKFPFGMHRFVVGILRWQYRVYAYWAGLSDHYPPFSLSS